MKKIVLTAVMAMLIGSVAQADVIDYYQLIDFHTDLGGTGDGTIDGTGDWTQATSVHPNYNSDNRYAYYSNNGGAAGENSDATATWTFDNVADGTYDIIATWASGTWGASGDYTVSDGGTGSTVSFKNGPDHDTGWIFDDDSEAHWFQNIGSVTVTDGDVVVTLGFSAGQSADEALIADAVALVPEPATVGMLMLGGTVALLVRRSATRQS